MRLNVSIAAFCDLYITVSEVSIAISYSIFTNLDKKNKLVTFKKVLFGILIFFFVFVALVIFFEFLLFAEICSALPGDLVQLNLGFL